jgi:hypothetical protein
MLNLFQHNTPPLVILKKIQDDELGYGNIYAETAELAA